MPGVQLMEIARVMYERAGERNGIQVPWEELSPEFQNEYLEDAQVALSYVRERASENETRIAILVGVNKRLEEGLRGLRAQEIRRKALVRTLSSSFIRLENLYDNARETSTPAQLAEAQLFYETLEELRRSYDFDTEE